jgi:hypothetical protein
LLILWNRPIGGALQAADGGSYVAPQVWASTSALLGASLVLAARVKLSGWDLKARC